jgi:hypothetical protein
MGVRRWIITVCGLFIVLIAMIYAHIQWRNINWVHDPHHQVESAVIDSLYNHPMTKFGDDWFYQYPTPEGHFDITCKSGKHLEAGYVTGYYGATLELGPDCTSWGLSR